jgi:hypothetical protein
VNEADWSALANRHGGLASPPVATDAVIDNPDPADARINPKVPNPNPTYRYVFKDGTQLTARGGQIGADGKATDYVVVDPGTALKPDTAATRTPSPTSQLDRIDAQGRVIPPTDTTTRPAKLRDPATGTVTDLPDAKTNAKPSGTFTNIVDPRDPNKQRIIGFVDTGDNSYHQLPAEADPTTGRQIVNTGTKILAVDKDNKVTELATIDKSSPFQAVTINGKVYRFDPNEKDVTKSLQPMGDQTPPDIRDAQNNPMVWDKAQGKYVYAPGVQPASTVSTNTTSPWLIWYDQQGNEVKRQKNDNYVAPTPTALTADTTSPYVPMWDPTKNQVTWTDNRNQVKASDAVAQLANSLGLKVAAGSMSEKSAQDLITSAINAMNAHTNQVNAQTAQQTVDVNAANNVLSNVQNAAQTGAGLINQRLSSAQGMLGQVLGLAGQGQRSGNMGGGLMSAPAGLGEALVGGITGWTNELAGGPDVYQSAANLVRRADPSGAMGGDAATAYAALGQMLQKYRDLTGQPHPAEGIASQSQQQLNTGFNAPNTLYNPQASTAAMNAAGYQDTPAGRAAAAQANPALLQTPVPAVQQPVGPTQTYVPPGDSSYSYATSPWNAQPGPSFVAPMTMPPLPQPPKQTVTVSVG